MSSELVLESIDELLALDPPGQTTLASASMETLVAAAARYRGLWLDLLSVAESLPDDRDEMSQAQLFERLLVVIGSNFDYAANRILNAGDHGELHSTAFVASDTEIVTSVIAAINARIEDTGEARPIDVAHLFGCYLLANYILYLTAATALRMAAGGAMSPTRKRNFDRQFSVSLSHIAEWLGTASVGVGALVSRIVKSGLRQAARIASEQVEASDVDHAPGPFSLVRPQDLGLLAARDSAMIHRYGAKGVGEEFELQLGYTLQSLGFITVPALPGERSVDHYCLSYEGGSKLPFLVDGKTTKGDYGLPARDERAFKEYVHDLEVSTLALPDPALLLIVGPRGSSTLEGKLKRLDDAIRPAVRFLRAQLLADLRELTPGAIPSDLFLKALEVEPLIVREDFPAKLAERLEEVQIAHQVMVRKAKLSWQP